MIAEWLGVTGTCRNPALLKREGNEYFRQTESGSVWAERVDNLLFEQPDGHVFNLICDYVKLSILRFWTQIQPDWKATPTMACTWQAPAPILRNQIGSKSNRCIQVENSSIGYEMKIGLWTRSQKRNPRQESRMLRKPFPPSPTFNLLFRSHNTLFIWRSTIGIRAGASGR